MNKQNLDSNEQLIAILDNLTANLVSESKYTPFLERLFERRKGTWCSLHQVFSDLAERPDDILLLLSNNEISVTWLDYPHSKPSEGHALILFFLEENYWSKTAFFNRNVLAKKPVNAKKKEQALKS